MDRFEKRVGIRSLPQNSRPRTYHRKQDKIPCPNCGFDRLIDTGTNTRSQTYLPDDPGYEDADYYQKCGRCKARIGIRKLNSTI